MCVTVCVDLKIERPPIWLARPLFLFRTKLPGVGTGPERGKIANNITHLLRKLSTVTTTEYYYTITTTKLTVERRKLGRKPRFGIGI